MDASSSTDLALAILGAGAALFWDHSINNGRWLSNILNRYNVDRLDVAPGRAEFVRGESRAPVGRLMFHGDKVITNEKGSFIIRKVSIITEAGQRIWTGSRSELDVPLEACTVAMPYDITLKRDKIAVLETELGDFKTRLAVVQAQASRHLMNQYDFIREFSVVAGTVKHNIGASVIVPQNTGRNQYSYSRNVQAGENAASGGQEGGE